MSFSFSEVDRQAVFKDWLQQYEGLVFKIVYSFEREPVDRQDLFQEILLQLWRSTANFKRKSSPSTWVYRVAFNTAICWQRGQRKLEKWQSLETIDGDRWRCPNVPNENDSARIERLYAAIQQLPKVDASLVIMQLDGLSYREMAEVSGLKENHIGVKLNRTKYRLAELLKEETR